MAFHNNDQQEILNRFNADIRKELILIENLTKSRQRDLTRVEQRYDNDIQRHQQTIRRITREIVQIEREIARHKK